MELGGETCGGWLGPKDRDWERFAVEPQASCSLGRSRS